MVGCGVVWVQSDRLAILGLRSRPVPIRLLQDCQCGVRLAQCRIKFDSSLRCTADFWRCLIMGNHLAIKENYVRLCQPCECLCVGWIFCSGLVKVVDCIV